MKKQILWIVGLLIFGMGSDGKAQDFGQGHIGLRQSFNPGRGDSGQWCDPDGTYQIQSGRYSGTLNLFRGGGSIFYAVVGYDERIVNVSCQGNFISFTRLTTQPAGSQLFSGQISYGQGQKVISGSWSGTGGSGSFSATQTTGPGHGGPEPGGPGNWCYVDGAYQVQTGIYSATMNLFRGEGSIFYAVIGYNERIVNVSCQGNFVSFTRLTTQPAGSQLFSGQISFGQGQRVISGSWSGTGGSGSFTATGSAR